MMGQSAPLEFTACCPRRVRGWDVGVCELLPGPGRRMRAAGQIGEFAADRSRAPRFGAAMAEIGGKSAGGALRPNEQAGHRDGGRPPVNARRLPAVDFSPNARAKRLAAVARSD